MSQLNWAYSAMLPLLASGLLGYAVELRGEDTLALEETTLETIVVTATAEGEIENISLKPASVLEGDRKLLRDTNSIAETIDGLPGVSTTYFGPMASRPIIRGLEGDRIRLLQNGVNNIDASSLSYDHAVPQDPISVDRIEVIRGPAALRYGNVVGGVVNTVDQRIPDTPVQGVTGEMDMSYGSAETLRKSAAKVQGGNDRFTLHFDIFSRKNNDIKIPGQSWSARQRAGNGSYQPPNHDHGDHGHDHGGDHSHASKLTSTEGRLPNSSSRTDGGAIGGSWFWDEGYAGISYSRYDSNYGSVAEPDVRLKMGQERWATAAEVRNISDMVSSVHFDFAYTNYEHQEIADSQAVTEFKNKGYEGKIELKHQAIGPFQGIVGVQWDKNRFSALGEEAFVPKTQNRHWGLFAVEETPLADKVLLHTGFRVDRHQLSPSAKAEERFSDVESRHFTAFSGSIGTTVEVSPTWRTDVTLSYLQRAPTFYELYSNGEHVATGTFEVGNADLDKEKSVGIDWAWLFESGDYTGRLGVFYNRFSNFIALGRTGQFCHSHGDHNHCSTDPVDGTAEYRYGGVRADFYGIEAQAVFPLASGPFGRFSLGVKGDYIHTKNLDTGEPLPRIPPLRFGLQLDYQKGPWEADVTVRHAASQHRVPSHDVPTDNYTTLGIGASYQLYQKNTRYLFYVRGENLTNEDIRYSTSLVRDIAPLAGRSLITGVNILF